MLPVIEHDDPMAARVRAGDRDRYLAALFAPRQARAGLLALYALNIELARIGESVSEPALGDIRLQWWREAVQAAGRGEVTGHPVADALGAATRRHGLPGAHLAALIDARAFDIGDAPMPDMAALKTYLGKTAGGLFALAAHMIEGGPFKPEAAAREAGLAYGLTGLMRSLPLHMAQGKMFLPATHGWAKEEEAATALAGLRGTVRDALDRARAGLREAPAAARIAFLPLALVDPYLRALGRPGLDPLRQRADIGPVERLWRLTRAAMRGRV